MFNKVAEIFDLKTEDSLRTCFRQMEEELIQAIAPLEQVLDNPVGSMDYQTNFQHGDWVGAWRNRVCKYLMLVTAFVEHAKSDCFSLVKAPGITDEVRKSHKNGLAGPFMAWHGRLEKLVEDIDNRQNWCKKMLDSERKGSQGGYRAA